MVSTPEDLGPFAAQAASPARQLRANYQGILRIDDRILPVLYILDPGTGCPVIPVPADGPDAPADEDLESMTLLIPDEGVEAIQMLCRAREVNPYTHEAPDRHLIYHGPAHARRWLLLEPESIRKQNQVFEPALLIAPNPLRSAEPGICKRTNALRDPHTLLPVSRERFGQNNDQAVMVGIDPLGIDIRTRYGPRRIGFEVASMTPALAEQALAAILGSQAAPAPAATKEARP
ncbi:MAG: hypothetical protein IT435_19800 [Phycisphaerales bacterium]|nr:hypothetical protein [Phycisphaerales bacterium]